MNRILRLWSPCILHTHTHMCVQSLLPMRLATVSGQCNTLQHTATHCKTYPRVSYTHTHTHTCVCVVFIAKGTGDCQWTRQHTAIHHNSLQHTVTHCNTLQHTATRIPVYLTHTHTYTHMCVCSLYRQRDLRLSMDADTEPQKLAGVTALQRLSLQITSQWSFCCSVLQCVAACCSVL